MVPTARENRRPRRLIVIAAFTLTLTLVLFVAYRLSWLSPPYHTPGEPPAAAIQIMPSDEYDALIASHARPFILEIPVSTGSILVFGAEHTKDPADPQIRQIREQWQSFAPTIALIEGRPGGPLAALGDPVRQFGESGLAYAMARRDDIPCKTWEPRREAEIAEMLTRFPREHVALFYILRPYFSNFRHGRPANPDASLESTRAERTRWKGLENTFATVAQIDALWQRDFAGLPDWRDTSDEFGWPGYLAPIALASRDARTIHLVHCALDLATQGHRVFVLCGSSHAVRAEPALRAALSQP